MKSKTILFWLVAAVAISVYCLLYTTVRLEQLAESLRQTERRITFLQNEIIERTE